MPCHAMCVIMPCSSHAVCRSSHFPLRVRGCGSRLSVHSGRSGTASCRFCPVACDVMRILIAGRCMHLATVSVWRCDVHRQGKALRWIWLLPHGPAGCSEMRLISVWYGMGRFVWRRCLGGFIFLLMLLGCDSARASAMLEREVSLLGW